MAIQEAKQQHPDMLVTKAVVIRETESPNEEEQQHRVQVQQQQKPKQQQQQAQNTHKAQSDTVVHTLLCHCDKKELFCKI